MELSKITKNLKIIPGPSDEVQSWNFPECKCGNLPLRQSFTFIRPKYIILLVMTRYFCVFKFQIRFHVLFFLTLQ